MANDIGNVRGCNGTSMNLNTQKGDGAFKPSCSSGTANPMDTKPMRAPEGSVPMPK